MRRSLDGLSVGDAFGQCFFMDPAVVVSTLEARTLPKGPWYYTDDTEMALSVVECLERRGRIDEDELAQAFAERYSRAPNRGYGGTAHEILRAICMGESWRTAAQRVFSGDGSMGNGAAMRVAPLGAYFAEDLDAVRAQALASAAPTHAHVDGQAGAVAVAIATAMVWQKRQDLDPGPMFRAVLDHTPDGPTRRGIEKACELLAQDMSVPSAAAILGSGYRVISSDTVPFALFCVGRFFRDGFAEAMWQTVSGLGDRDTTCAIVGGILAMTESDIPAEWLSWREPLVY